MKHADTNERFEPMCEPFDMYSVSNMGYVINVDEDMIVPALQDDSNGRLYVRLSATNAQGNHVTKVAYIAKLVAEMFVPNEYNESFVGFKDGDTLNNRADNLFYASNMFQAGDGLDRPKRLEVEPTRHKLMCEIGEALNNDDMETAQRLGDIVWNLENDNTDIQTEYDWK
ncbi:hypothetical protein GH863_30730 [Bacillus thuringiensis]|nr:hypothetical protein [Bacillus thuringiensis]